MPKQELEIRPGTGKPTVLSESKKYYFSNFWQDSLQRFLSRKLNLVALAVLSSLVLVSSLTPLISEHLLRISPTRLNPRNRFKSSGFTEKIGDIQVVHWLGTDDIGRDVLSRLLHAGGTSLWVGVLVTLTALLIGVPLGLVAGYYRGSLDSSIFALIQLINNIPLFYVFIILGQIFRPDVIFLSLMLGGLSWTRLARQVRVLTLSLRNRDFVVASIVNGASPTRILFQHILPNLTSILLVLGAEQMVTAMFSEAALSYLGFGLADNNISWGKLMAHSFEYMNYSGNENLFFVLGPLLALLSFVLTIYWLADGLRDALEPTLS